MSSQPQETQHPFQTSRWFLNSLLRIFIRQCSADVLEAKTFHPGSRVRIPSTQSSDFRLMILHRVDMSSFRAINRPSESPSKPHSRRRPLSNVVSQQCHETDGGMASALSPEQAPCAKRKLDRAKNQVSPKVMITAAQQQRTSPETHRMKSPKARPWAAVLPTHQQSPGLSKNKGDIRQAVAKAEKAMQTPSKKKGTSNASTSRARRQQASSEKNLVPSIEHSARKRITRSTPDCGTDGAKESDYIPSPAELADATPSSASSTSSRRNPCEHISTCPNTGSSAMLGSTSDSSPLKSPPWASDTLVIKKESTPAPQSSPNLETVVTPMLPSPSIWNSKLRRKRFEEADFVELPKEVFDYKKTKKEMRQQLAVKKQVMMAGKRKEKGKIAERRSLAETYKQTQKTDKRKADNEGKHMEPRKRHKSLKSQKHGFHDCSTRDDRNTVIKESDSSKKMSAQKPPTGKSLRQGAQRYGVVAVKAEDRSGINDVRCHVDIEASGCSSEGATIQKAQRSSRAGAEARDFQLHEEQSGQSGGQASRDNGQQKRPPNEGWRKPYERREVSVPEVLRSCSCALLPEYFTSNPGYVPCLATWPGGKLDFFEHVKQISCCRGSIHPPMVIDACKRMLREEGYPCRGDEQSLELIFGFAHEVLSTNNRGSDHSGRAQSSIPPPAFYGYGESYRPPLNAAGSSRSAQTTNKELCSLGFHLGPERSLPPKEAPNKPTLPENLWVHERVKTTTNPTSSSFDQHPSSAIVDDASGYPTQPDSFPPGKRSGADIPSHHIFDSSINGEENVTLRKITKGLPGASSGRPEPQASFRAQRARHQSMPVELIRRNNAASERHPSPQPPRRRRDHALEEISNNAILLNLDRKLASFERVLLERLPATTPTQAAAVAPATAPTATANAAGQGGDGAEGSQVRKKKKRPSRAERQLKRPVLDRHVPAHLRLPDQGIVEVGRLVNHYERHAKAPYAFGWSGRLYAEYKHLLTRSGDGVPVWTADEINRVTQ